MKTKKVFLISLSAALILSFSSLVTAVDPPPGECYYTNTCPQREINHCPSESPVCICQFSINTFQCFDGTENVLSNCECYSVLNCGSQGQACCPDNKCTAGLSCQNGICKQPQAYCGDGTCSAGETGSSCPADCEIDGGGSCGDNTCSNSETCSTCAADCGACSSGNSPPVLTSITSSVSQVQNGTTVTINSVASDPDGDKIRLVCGTVPTKNDLCDSSNTVSTYSNPKCTFKAPWKDDAIHKVYCKARDVNGALSVVKYVNITARNSPILNFIMAPEAVRVGITVTINSSGSDPMGDQVRLICGETPGSSGLCTGLMFASNPSCSFQSSWSDELQHEIYCFLQDGHKFNSSVSSALITSKNIPSLSSINILPPVIKEGNSVTVFSESSDPLAEQIRLVCREGAEQRCSGDFSAANASCTFSSPWSDSGTKTLACTIQDASNFISSQKSVSVVSDNTPPELTVSHSPENPITNSSGAIVSIVALAYDQSGIANIHIVKKIGNAIELLETCTASPCEYTSNFSIGTYYYLATAVDVPGNERRDPATAWKNFTVLQTVEIMAASASNSCPSEVETVDVRCTSSVVNVNCIGAKIGGRECIWTPESRWEGNDAVFDGCNVGPITQTACGIGAREILCYVKTNKCLQVGTNKTSNIDVQEDPVAQQCKDYITETDCITDALCTWIPFCSESKNSTLNAQCVPADIVPRYQCISGTCGAECDGSVECPAKLLGNACYHSGACSSSCACNYNEDFCPTPGTVSGQTCYYGSQSCTDSGCEISTCSLAINNRCDSNNGCVVDKSIVEINGGITLSDQEPAAGEIVNAEFECEITNSLYGFTRKCIRDNTNINSFDIDQETGVRVLGTYEAESSRSGNDCTVEGVSVSLCKIGDSIKINHNFDSDVATFRILGETDGWVNLTVKIDGVPKAKRTIKLPAYDTVYVSADVTSGVHDVEFVLSDKQSVNSKIKLDAVAVVSGVIDFMSREDWVPWENWDNARQVWTAQIDTNVYHSTLEINASDSETGISGVFTKSYTVDFVRVVDVSIKFPEEEAKTIKKENNKPVFYKPMTVEFIASGKVRNIQSGEQQNCDAGNCIAAFSVDNGPFISVPYDEFAGAFSYELSSNGMQCNTEHSIKVKITKTSQPEEGASGSSERRFILKCETVMLISPPEKRAALGFSGLAFRILVVNPDSVAKSYDLELSLPRSEFMLSNLQFSCTGTDSGCLLSNDHEVSLASSPNSVASASVYVDANRAGIYPIDFTTTGTNEFSEQATLQVFAESLPEFSLLQLLIVILIAPLVYSLVRKKVL